MSCSTAGSNSYDKIKVLCACERTLQAIEDGREEWKKERFTGKRKYWLFGRILTVEEAFLRAGRGAYLSHMCSYGLQEMTVKQAARAARLCVGDTVCLTQDELAAISSYWEALDDHTTNGIESNGLRGDQSNPGENEGTPEGKQPSSSSDPSVLR